MADRATIVDTGHPYRRAGRILVKAPAPVIFDILADPSRHPEFDGSGTVVSSTAASPQRLRQGATFGMSMRLGVPYAIKNTARR